MEGVALIALFTVCLLLAAVCAWCARLAVRSSLEAEHSEKRVTAMRGRIVALESTVERLDVSLRKLWGKTSYLRRRDQLPPEPEPDMPLGGDRLVRDAVNVNGEVDPELEATLRLQSAPPMAPGSH